LGIVHQLGAAQFDVIDAVDQVLLVLLSTQNNGGNFLGWELRRALANTPTPRGQRWHESQNNLDSQLLVRKKPIVLSIVFNVAATKSIALFLMLGSSGKVAKKISMSPKFRSISSL
jgi:hypothetical protein